MTKTYPITDEKFNKALTLIRQNGGTIFIDGSFEVMGASGRFERSGDTLNIEVEKKPFFASWKRIESKLDAFFR